MRKQISVMVVTLVTLELASLKLAVLRAVALLSVLAPASRSPSPLARRRWPLLVHTSRCARTV